MRITFSMVPVEIYITQVVHQKSDIFADAPVVGFERDLIEVLDRLTKIFGFQKWLQHLSKNKRKVNINLNVVTQFQLGKN